MNAEESLQDFHGAIDGVVHIDWLSTALTVLCVVAITALASRLIVKLLRRVLSHDQSPLPTASIFINIARVVIWALGVSVILSTFFGVDVSAAIAALGVGGIALSLGFQDTISNLIGGLQVSIMGIIQPGDYVEVEGQRGVVRDVTWRHATIADRAGNVFIVPNAVINKSSIVKLPPENKIVIPISVTTDGKGIDETVEAIRQVAKAAAEKLTALEKEPSASLGTVTDFGFGGTIVLWVSPDADVLAVKDAVIRAVAPLTRGEADQA